MALKVAVTTTSQDEFNKEARELLKREGLEVLFYSQAKILIQKEFFKMMDGCVGVIAGTETYDRNTLSHLPNLKVISRIGVGLDTIDLRACEELGIKVYITPDGPTKAVAELVIGFILILLRHIPVMDKNLHAGRWEKRLGRLFSEKRIGIIGLGRIGQEVARLSQSLGAQAYYYDPYVKESRVKNIKKINLDKLLEICDIITLHLPLTQENRHLIDKRELNRMKESAILINCSRGGIVNEKALYKALKEQRIAGAACDVFQEEPYRGPLQELDNIILTPHMGSYTAEAKAKMELCAVQNLITGLREKQFLGGKA